MMKRKWLAGIGLGLTAAFALSACAGTTEAGDSAGSSSTGSESSDVVTLTMVESLAFPERTALMRGILDRFEAENSDIKVDLISPPTEQADQQILQLLQSGSGADIVEVRDTTIKPWVQNGWLANLDTLLADWAGWEDLTGAALADARQVDDTAYMLPYGGYGISVFYRSDMLADAGYDAPPTTWDEMLEMAQAIHAPGEGRIGYALRGGRNGFSNVILALEAYNAPYLDLSNTFLQKDGTSTLFTAPYALEALETYFQLAEVSGADAINWGYPEMVEAFTNGSTAFLLQDPEVIAMVQASESVPQDGWDTAPMLLGPEGKTIRYLGNAGWGVVEQSAHQEEAARVVAYLAETAQAVEFAEGNSLVPPVKGANDSEFYNQQPWQSYQTMNGDAETWIVGRQPRTVDFWVEWQEKADLEQQEVILGTRTPQELLDSWDAFWKEKLGL
jgi:multiple sugar transport system substrate-binding protein